MGAEALVAGTLISAIGSVKSAQDQADALEQQAQARFLTAKQAELSAKREAEMAARKGEKIKGAQISAFGRSGVTLEGSPLMMLEETAANISEEISAILASARFKAGTISAEGQLDLVKAGQTRTAGYLQAGGSILTGAARFGMINDAPSTIDVGIQGGQ